MASSNPSPDPNKPEQTGTGQGTQASVRPVISMGLAFRLAFPLAMVTAVIVLAFIPGYARLKITAQTPSPAMTTLTSLLWFAVFCGLASMATVEVAKRLAGLRGLYQERQVRLWLQERAESDADSVALSTQLDAVLGVKAAAADGYFTKRRALYNLPVGQLVAQIGVAAERAISNPDSYGKLISALTGAATMPPPPPPPPKATGSDKEGPSDEERAKRAYQSQLLRTALDQLQISVSDGWRRYVQWTAVWLSGAYGFALAYLMNLTGRSVYVVAAILIGGFFSWLAKDVSGGLERWRRQ